MSSLPALTQHAAAPELTASGIAFYSVAATVIPVLFIAIAVQGQFLQDLLSGIASAMRRLQKLTLQQPRSKGGALLLIATALLGSLALPVAFMAIMLLVLFILSFAAFGEIASVVELAARGLGVQLGAPGTFTPQQVEAVVAWSIVLLTLITLAASVLALGKYTVRLFGGEVNRARRRRAVAGYEAPDDGGFIQYPPGG